MKRRFIVFLAFAALALPVDAQVFTQPRFVSSAGQKKVGQYIWVWRTEKIPMKHEEEIEADCPVDYVVTGGGYHQTAVGVFESTPTSGFDGWVVEAGAGYSGPNTVTVYAGCAPAK